MKRIVANTGPLLHLHEADALGLLPLIGETHLPSAVFQELRARKQFTPPGWLKVNALAGRTANRAQAWQQAGLVHVGEAEALSLAMECQADWFLTDDAAARLLAVSLGIEARGSLGVVLWAAATELIDQKQAAQFLGGLEKSSLWLSARVLTEARAALGKLSQP